MFGRRQKEQLAAERRRSADLERELERHTLAEGSESGIPEAMARANGEALSNRPCAAPAYSFVPDAMHDDRFHALRREYPYFGYVGAKVEGVEPVAMLSNNDDRVAQCYFFYGHDAFETLSLRVWRRLAEGAGHVFDVGAFSGVYSLVAARANRGAKVYSFEPMERTFWRLVDNVRANRLSRRVEAFDLAASDEDGRADLNVFRGPRVLRSGSSLVAKEGQTVAQTQPVETARLDTFVGRQGIPGVDLVKLDVEQAEVRAIKGMAGLLGEHTPSVLVEIFSGKNLREIAGVLSPHGYSFAVLDDLAQRAHLGDAGAHERGRNVLFRAQPPEELRAFLGSIAPL